MRLHRFYYPLIGNQTKRFFIDDPLFFYQFKNVFRAKKGDEALIIDGNCNEYRIQIENFSKNRVEVILLEKTKNKKELKKELWLFISLLKRENFELVVQKVTELGIKKIFPIRTIRTIKQNINEIRMKKIITEAVEQAERGIIPEYHSILSFKEAVDVAEKSDAIFFCDTKNNKISKNIYKGNIWSIFVGPEGGWVEEERKIIEEKKWNIISLSPFTLRAETAAIVATGKIASYAKEE